MLFLTYATLRSNRGDKGTRLQQILEWVGDEYDGMIVFDEAHEMAGVAGGEGSFGTKQGSGQGIAGVRLQNLLPRARPLRVRDRRVRRQQPGLCHAAWPVGSGHGVRRSTDLRRLAAPWRDRRAGADRARPENAGPLCLTRAELLLETMWEEASEAEFSALWQAEVEKMSGKTRTNTLYLVTGLLLPVWDRLPDDHVQVWRLNTDDSQSFLGRIVPAPLVTRLADAFGIAATITVSDAETARHVMGSGGITALGAYRLKRSLVAGQLRLELLDWPHTRLPELKSAGCFTEIIQHKTRMFIPVATAATVIDRINT